MSEYSIKKEDAIEFLKENGLGGEITEKLLYKVSL